MISAWWLVPAVAVGVIIGIFAGALCAAAKSDP